MTALEPGQHDPLAKEWIVRYRSMGDPDVLLMGTGDLADLVARVVERERGKALAEAVRIAQDAGHPYALLRPERPLSPDEQAAAFYMREQIVDFIEAAAARPAEGTPDA